MKDARGRKHGLILSGGGANGAYEVGVLHALLCGESPATEYAPLEPDVFAGTSIGAYNAALLVSDLTTVGPATAIEHLRYIWLEVIPREDSTGHNFVMRFRLDPLQFLSPNYALRHPVENTMQFAEDLSYFAADWYRRGLTFLLSPRDVETRILKLFDLSTVISNEPEQRLIRETIDFGKIRRSDKALRIATTNWSTGDLKVFERTDLTDDIGPQAILASTSLPGIFPQVKIDDDYFADGGVVMNTPLNLAIDAGADVLHVIYLDPDVKFIPILPVRNTLDTFGRFLVVSFAATMNRDIEVARRVNRGLKVYEQALSGGPVNARDVRHFIAVAERLSRVEHPSEYKKITIHLYRPQDTLGGVIGMLDFRRERVEALIEQGFEDTIYHDCKANRCVIPD
ncbi:MAG: patatin-like phospholipase family protein [Acidobacteria bacterium]|nr:patatin-like phospholipase family protein [Acidobacteriota bacterium]